MSHQTAAADERELKRRQLESLWLGGSTSLESEEDAADFLKTVGFALRYNPTPSLPLASMYKASGETRRGIELTNALLASAEGIEISVVADRLVLVHRTLVPSLYALRSRNRSAGLSSNAERVLGLIAAEGHATSGEVRRYLGVAGLKRPDPGDLALGDLQRDLRIDRGPSSVPKKGIPYLSPEGYPYRIFESAHRDLVRASGKIKPDVAVRMLIESYLGAAVFVASRKLASMFKLLFSEIEMNAAIDKLAAEGMLTRTSKYLVWVG